MSKLLDGRDRLLCHVVDGLAVAALPLSLHAGQGIWSPDAATRASCGRVPGA
jgi:hypothetical protein